VALASSSSGRVGADGLGQFKVGLEVANADQDGIGVARTGCPGVGSRDGYQVVTGFRVAMVRVPDSVERLPVAEVPQVRPWRRCASAANCHEVGVFALDLVIQDYLGALHREAGIDLPGYAAIIYGV
jgi:hypothetical protein